MSRRYAAGNGSPLDHPTHVATDVLQLAVLLVAVLQVPLLQMALL